jgi:hypothetical protein
VLLERDLFAVVPDGVEVQVEPALAVVEPDLAALPAQSFQQGQVAGAPDPVGVAGQVGGLGQREKSQREAEPRVGAERERVAGPAPPAALEHQQRGHGVERTEHLGARVVGRADELIEAELDHRREQQVQPGVVAVVAGPGRPGTEGLGRDRFQPRRRAGRAASF